MARQMTCSTKCSLESVARQMTFSKYKVQSGICGFFNGLKLVVYGVPILYLQELQYIDVILDVTETDETERRCRFKDNETLG